MVVLKVRVASLVMAYENLSNLGLGLGSAPSAWSGHLTSVVRYTCGEAMPLLASYGCSWLLAGPLKSLFYVLIMEVSMMRLFHFPA
jgi:hypothetical protein